MPDNSTWNPKPPPPDPSKSEAERLAEQQPITYLATAPPTASAPTEGLPSDPVRGRWYGFASRPANLYTIGPDNVWRAVILVSVV